MAAGHRAVGRPAGRVCERAGARPQYGLLGGLGGTWSVTGHEVHEKPHPTENQHTGNADAFSLDGLAGSLQLCPSTDKA